MQQPDLSQLIRQIMQLQSDQVQQLSYIGDTVQAESDMSLETFQATVPNIT